MYKYVSRMITQAIVKHHDIYKTVMWNTMIAQATVVAQNLQKNRFTYSPLKENISTAHDLVTHNETPR